MLSADGLAALAPPPEIPSAPEAVEVHELHDSFGLPESPLEEFDDLFDDLPAEEVLITEDSPPQAATFGKSNIIDNGADISVSIDEGDDDDSTLDDTVNVTFTVEDLLLETDIYLRTHGTTGALQRDDGGGFEDATENGNAIIPGDFNRIVLKMEAPEASDDEFAELWNSLFDEALMEFIIDETLHTDGAELKISATKIKVDGGTISTRNLATGTTDHLNGASEGDSGSLTLYGPQIRIKNGSKILTHSDSDSSQSGALEITADGSLDDITSGFVQAPILPADLTITDAVVEIDNSLIRAGDIVVDVLSDSSDLYDDEESQGTFDEAIQEYIAAISIGAGVAFSEATAELIVSDSDIEGDNIDLLSEAQTDAEAIVLTLYIAVAYGHSAPTSKITISDASTIKADGYLNVDSHAESDMSVYAQQALVGISNTVEKFNVTLNVAYSKLVSKIDVSSDSYIETTGSAVFNADACKSHDNGSQAAANGDGTLGLAFNINVAFVDVDVLMDADADVGSNLTLNAFYEATKNDATASASAGDGTIFGGLQTNIRRVPVR